jgi:hypothetical protein
MLSNTSVFLDTVEGQPQRGEEMAKGKPGADSSVIVTSQIMGKGLVDLAKALYGQAPAYWGRYFTSTTAGGNVEYRHLKENKPLRENDIRVLPIARQTKKVNGSVSDGSTDAGIMPTTCSRLSEWTTWRA